MITGLGDVTLDEEERRRKKKEKKARKLLEQAANGMAVDSERVFRTFRFCGEVLIHLSSAAHVENSEKKKKKKRKHGEESVEETVMHVDSERWSQIIS